jgi:hypothetical protein
MVDLKNSNFVSRVRIYGGEDYGYLKLNEYWVYVGDNSNIT